MSQIPLQLRAVGPILCIAAVLLTLDASVAAPTGVITAIVVIAAQVFRQVIVIRPSCKAVPRSAGGRELLHE